MSRFKGFDPERSSRCVCRGLIASVALDIKSREGVNLAAGQCQSSQGNMQDTTSSWQTGQGFDREHGGGLPGATA